ncbi:MAG: hypothetical protein [Caudoviricetes sp.]|nr:MAG: hypothetical protein [Caudoviricetes sp.]
MFNTIFKRRQPSRGYNFTMLAKKNNPHNFFDNLNLFHSGLSLQKKKTGGALFVPRDAWIKTKKAQFEWADREAVTKNYKNSVLETLKAIVKCCNADGISTASLLGISQKRVEMLPGSPAAVRTIQRHIKILRDAGSIDRSEQPGFKDLVTTKLMGHKEFSCQQYDKMSHVFKCPTKIINNHNIITHSDKDVSLMNIDRNTEDAYNEYCEMRKKEKIKTSWMSGPSKTPALPTPEHAAIFEKLRKINVDQFSAARWVKLYYLNDLQRMLKEAELKRNPGAWLRTIIRKSDERNFNHDFDMATIRLEDEPGARKKASLWGCIGQALNMAPQPVQSVFKAHRNRAEDEGQIVELVGPVKPHVWSHMLLQKESEASPKVVIKLNAERKLTRKEIIPTTPAGWEAKLLREELEREGVVFT